MLRPVGLVYGTPHPCPIGLCGDPREARTRAYGKWQSVRLDLFDICVLSDLNSMPDLADQLPVLLPRILAWANAQADSILHQGDPLNAAGLTLASRVGVAQPERIRILTVTTVPAPEDPELQRIAVEQNLIGPSTAGLTLGYGIFILNGCLTPRLLAHECRHVYQYEVAGSIEAFLPLYLQQIAEFTYHRAPYELDARAWEWVVL